LHQSFEDDGGELVEFVPDDMVVKKARVITNISYTLGLERNVLLKQGQYNARKMPL